MKYRLYIDESGNPDLEHADDPRYRFLGLTGVIMDLDYVARVVAPEVEKIKRNFFPYHPDEPVIFHRKEIMNRLPPFEALRNKEIEEQFNEALLNMFDRFEFVALTVVIDKKVQRDLYKVWRYDPYHYCLAVTLERYIHFLEGKNARGDAMAESRGGKEDLRLKRSFEKLYAEGTDFVAADRFTRSLTSKQLKVKPKSNNIAGLQIADLIAHPSQRYALLQHKKINDDREVFGDKIAEILVRSKYYRSKAGIIEGYGIKVLP
jgi:hypothetical protein